MSTTSTSMNTSTTAIIRAARALRIPLVDRSIWSDLAASYKLPAVSPEMAAWLDRHPEAGNPAPATRVGRKLTTAALEAWRVLYAPSVRSVLAAPAKHRPAAKRAYRAQLVG
jgi:hypothetical protein